MSTVESKKAQRRNLKVTNAWLNSDGIAIEGQALRVAAEVVVNSWRGLDDGEEL